MVTNDYSAGDPHGVTVGQVMDRPRIQPIFSWPQMVLFEVVALVAWAFLVLGR